MSLRGPRTRVVLTDKQKEEVYRLKYKEQIPLSTLRERYGCSIGTLAKACREIEARKYL